LLSIVVACRNEIRHIRSFLESLNGQDLDGIDWEVIIADGMSDDGTRQVLETQQQQMKRTRVIDNPGRIVSTGLNAAIAAARGEIILRMDMHTEYATDYCRRCLEALRLTGADNVGGAARTKASGVRARAIAAAFHSPFSTGGAKFHDENYEGYVDTVTYGCWRKSTLERLGLFDESLVRNQDDELNLRLTRAGGRIWQSAAIVSWYRPRSSISALFRQYFQYGFWKVAVIRKHLLPASWRHLVPAAFLAMNGLLLGVALAASVLNSDAYYVALDLWLGLVGIYLFTILVASVQTARNGGWATLPYLPVIFGAYHLSYGAGFLAGLMHFSRTPALRPSCESMFTRITR